MHYLVVGYIFHAHLRISEKEAPYFFCEVSKEHYNWMLNADMELQEVVYIKEDEKIYFCIFMQ